MNRSTTPEASPGYLQVLRESPGFRLLFAARSISLLGDWFSLLATIALLRETTGSDSKALSGLLILKLLPIFLAGPLAGVVADRFNRKAIMVISDLCRVVFVLLLLLVPFSSQPLMATYVLVLLQVLASAFFEPARGAALPQLVPDRALSAANALGAMAWSAMFTLGAAFGGIVTDLLGWRVALGIDALTYLVSAALVWRIVLPRRPARAKGPVDWQTITGMRDFREGLQYIARRPDLSTTLFLKTGWGMAGAITLILTLFGERIYNTNGRPDLNVAMLYVARAVGTGLGPWLARRIVAGEEPRAMRWLLTIAFVWSAIWYAAFAAVGNLFLAMACVTLSHLGGSVLWVYSSVLLQRMSPDEFRGRILSIDLGLATLAISLSTWIYGLLADMPGVELRSLAWALALTPLVPAAIWFWAASRWPVGQRPS